MLFLTAERAASSRIEALATPGRSTGSLVVPPPTERVRSAALGARFGDSPAHRNEHCHREAPGGSPAHQGPQHVPGPVVGAVKSIKVEDPVRTKVLVRSRDLGAIPVRTERKRTKIHN